MKVYNSKNRKMLSVIRLNIKESRCNLSKEILSYFQNKKSSYSENKIESFH